MPEALKSLAETTNNKLPVTMKELCVLLTQNLVVKDLDLGKNAPETKLKLVFQTKHKDTPLEYLPVTHTAVVGFVGNSKKYLNGVIETQNGNNSHNQTNFS